MKIAWLAFGVLIGFFIGSYIGFHESTGAIILIICAIPITISFFKAQKKAKEEEVEYLKAHSWWN